MIPGDVLLYGATSLVGRLIQIKTWAPVSHCEIAIGGGQVVASRDGIGVDTYHLRADDPLYVLRVRGTLDLAAALAWHETVRGQRYDLWGLARFFTIGAGKKDRQFCSEYATRFLRRGRMDPPPFAPGYDADLVSPGMFLSSPAFRRIVSPS